MCNICIYQTETDALIGTVMLEDTIAWHEKK